MLPLSEGALTSFILNNIMVIAQGLLWPSLDLILFLFFLKKCLLHFRFILLQLTLVLEGLLFGPECFPLAVRETADGTGVHWPLVHQRVRILSDDVETAKDPTNVV
jgi:hypothetical protein